MWQREILLGLAVVAVVTGSSLYPRDSPTRETKLLDGVWQFRTSEITDQNAGFREKWYNQPLVKSGWSIPMPVPSSFNDVTQEREIRDFIGWVWYQKYFYAPPSWQGNRRVILRFGSVHYYAQVYLNGVNVVNHTGGHLPFEVDVTSYLIFKPTDLAMNNLVVAVNNTLTPHTIPQGSVTYKDDPKRYPAHFYEYTVNFDFFNYAGIHRSVFLYSTPNVHITDLTLTTDILDDSTGSLTYSVVYESSTSASCSVNVLDADAQVVAQQSGCQGNVTIKPAHFWWPQTMSDKPGYLYTLVASVTGADGDHDTYQQPFGIRTVRTTETAFLINGRPFYFMGFGKHEDSDIRGKGLDFPLIVKDFNLIKWIGANCFRTSHYPYAEEIMDQADAQGIVVIDESPAVGLNIFDSEMLENHKRVMEELVKRDKNRPSVVMWSVANEPTSSQQASEHYFQEIVAFTKSLDSSRPVSAALNADVTKDKAGQFMDVIMMNRYFAWYSDIGYLQVIQQQVVSDYTDIFEHYRKPVLISEYGADTIQGLHMSPSFIFTEDYQTELMMNYHSAFDELRQKGFFVGEMIWNFADFMTVQQLNRVVGNKKGIFTRERQPKASAKLLRCRYLSLSNTTITDNALYCPAPKISYRFGHGN